MKTILEKMKTILKPLKLKGEEVEITCRAEGGLVHLHILSDRPRNIDLSFEAGEAAKLWSCLMGKYTTVTPDDVHGDTYKLWNHVDPVKGDLWEFIDCTGERLFSLDAHQALALAWAIERCCGIALYISTPGRETCQAAPAHVWVLSSRVMLSGDCVENGAEQLGGAERVFATKEAAFDALRGFLRLLVNEADRSPFHDVDGVIDTILGATSADETEWAYDGPDRSFRVTLYEREVEHGA